MAWESQWLSSGISWAYDTKAGLAIVWLEGVIAKRCPDSLSGPAIVDLLVLDALVARLRTDEELEEVHTVVLLFDSPGGCSVGLPESADAILELAETKRVVSFTDYQCCSAAYYLACATDGIEDDSMEGQWFFGAGAPAGLHDGTFRDLGDLVGTLFEESQ